MADTPMRTPPTPQEDHRHHEFSRINQTFSELGCLPQTLPKGSYVVPFFVMLFQGRPMNQLKCNGSVRGASSIRGARHIGSGQGRMGSHESDQQAGSALLITRSGSANRRSMTRGPLLNQGY